MKKSGGNEIDYVTIIKPHLKQKSTLSIRDKWILSKHFILEKEALNEEFVPFMLNTSNLKDYFFELFDKLMESGKPKGEILNHLIEDLGGLDGILNYWRAKF